MRVLGSTKSFVRAVEIVAAIELAMLLTIGISLPRAFVPLAHAERLDVISSADTLTAIQVAVPTFKPMQELPIFQMVTDCNAKPCVALTFDDGPNPQTTPQIVAILQKHHAKATFFVVGSRVGGNVELLRRMQDLGMEIGNHSWSHPMFTKLSPAQMQDEVQKTQQVLINSGLRAPRFFRPPYEDRNDLVRQTIQMPFALWNVDTKDWKSANPRSIIASVQAGAKPGSIVIMHDIHASTVAATETIVSELEKNYQLVTVSELLNLPADARGEYMQKP